MKLLGDRNWYLPSWLGWLPRLEHEPAIEAPPLPPRRKPSRNREAPPLEREAGLHSFRDRSSSSCTDNSGERGRLGCFRAQHMVGGGECAER